MQYYCLRAATDNIGDDIQILAARSQYPRVDAYVDRDRLSRDMRGLPPGKIILNGWYMHPRFLSVSWPPPDHVSALCISMHVATDPRVRFAFSRRTSIEFLKRCGPVGARDAHTKAFLGKLGVDAFYSGCMTMTLRSKGHEKAGPVVLCDPFGHDGHWNFIPPEKYLPIFESARFPLKEPVTVTHQVEPSMPTPERFRRVEELLDLYDRASLVITSRLHCALPCLALGTPVIFVNENGGDPRFSNMSSMLNPIGIQSLLSGTAKPLSERIPLELPRRLIQSCADFLKE